MSDKKLLQVTVSVQRLLGQMRQSTRPEDVASIYNQAKETVSQALSGTDPHVAPDMHRAILALMVQAHCVYRTRQASARGANRVIAAW